jgi:IS30 family transposase
MKPTSSEIAMTINLTPRKCLGYRSPVEAFLSELGRDVDRQRADPCLGPKA